MTDKPAKNADKSQKAFEKKVEISLDSPLTS